MTAATPSITFVTFVHNGAAQVVPAMDSVCEAIQRSGWPDAEVIVVDDGSTDDTAAVVSKYAANSEVTVRLISQQNLGRLEASRTGVNHARSDLVSFLGIRMRMHPDSLLHLAAQLAEHPERKVWNCHIDVPRERNVQAQFWHVMTYVGWRRYLREPRLVSFGAEDFDYYPKGTGGFVCPRELLLEAYSSLSSIYDDARYASDDTALIRYIASRERIWMFPGYGADYLARSDGGDFVRHTYDRGTLFLDSYLHPGTRLFWPLIAFFMATPLAVWTVVRHPRTLLAIPLVSVGAAASLKAIGVQDRDIRGFSLVAPAFGCLFAAGLWRGLLMVGRSALRRGGREETPSTSPPRR